MPDFSAGRSWTYCAVGAATVCLSIYCLLRPVIHYEHVQPDRATRVRARRVTDADSPPYAPDALPGARHVETAYGGIHVFEWGPEDGEKVLLLHGIGTPSVALGDMARRFAKKGCRVMIFDLFGRGYSDAPADVLFDERLYTTQILLVLASSTLSWTGSSAFHMVGYSLGGALVASFAAYHANLLRSATLVCPGGLVRPYHVSLSSRLLYSETLPLPRWFRIVIARRRLEPKRGVPSADVPVAAVAAHDDGEDVDFDQVPVCRHNPQGTKVGDVVAWQLRTNPGFVPSYMSTLRHAPIYGQHDGVWKRLRDQLALRRGVDGPPGLASGSICLILGERDPIVVKEEYIADSVAVLGEDAVHLRVLPGGHEIGIAKGAEIADAVMAAWTSSRNGQEGSSA